MSKNDDFVISIYILLLKKKAYLLIGNTFSQEVTILKKSFYYETFEWGRKVEIEAGLWTTAPNV